MSSEQINLEEMGKYLKKLIWDKEDLEHAKQFINQISYLSEEKFMNKDFEGLEEFEYFIANNNKILIPTIGQYSSGKSSLLNILIGEKYLPTSQGVCTNVGVIIEYTSNKNISELYEIKLKKSNKYFNFEKSKIICNDKTKIKDAIDKRNKEHRPLKLEDSFILLKVNIELFELIPEKYREKILLIDFPGLNVLENQNFFNSDVLSPLINQSDSFLFFNSGVVNTDENQKIIINLVEKIRNRKISFSYKNCLFIFNKWDLYIKNKDHSLAQAKNDLKEIFQNNQLDDIFEDIDIINCSAKNYNDFQKEKNDILNFEGYIQNLKNNFEEDYEMDEHDEDEDKNEQLYEYIVECIKSNKKSIKNLLITKVDVKTKENYFAKLENILKEDFKLEDGKKNEIINNYLIISNNIDNHEL
jgi:GTPase Era involved in 16S rRNA processing